MIYLRISVTWCTKCQMMLEEKDLVRWSKEKGESFIGNMMIVGIEIRDLAHKVSDDAGQERLEAHPATVDDIFEDIRDLSKAHAHDSRQSK